MNPPIKLFVDAHVFDGQYQGTRTFLKEIYALFSKKKDVLLFLGARNIGDLKKNFPEANNIFFIEYKSSSSIIRLVYELPAIIKKYNIDFAHFQYISPFVKNCKFLLTAHDVLFNEYPHEFSFFYRVTKNWLYKRSILKADIVTTVSAHSKKSIQKFFGLDPDKIYLIPNGVSEKFFEPYDKQKASAFISKKYGIEKFILFVSRIEPRKNHVLLLKVYLELKLYVQGYSLVFLGGESIKVPALHAIMAHLPKNIRAFIFISSEVDDSDLLEFYRAAVVFAYPSRAEGFGIPPLEAAALKIPVICSNTSAMEEFTFFGKTHISPFDPELFMNVLSNLIASLPDQAYLEHLSETIRNKYSWAASAEKLYQLIKKN